jgi:hypothetical protein
MVIDDTLGRYTLGMKESTRKRILFYLLAGLVAFFLIAMLMPVTSGPSWAAQRERQRKIVRERVEAAGGWGTLQQECVGLLSSGQTEFSWPRSDLASSSNLPPAIARLNPRDVRLYAAPDGVPIVRIKVFGMHSTGGRSTPYYGLWVLCRPVPADYIPRVDFGGNTVTGKILKITNSVFEVY